MRRNRNSHFENNHNQSERSTIHIPKVVCIPQQDAKAEMVLLVKGAFRT